MHAEEGLQWAASWSVHGLSVGCIKCKGACLHGCNRTFKRVVAGGACAVGQSDHPHDLQPQSKCTMLQAAWRHWGAPMPCSQSSAISVPEGVVAVLLQDIRTLMR